MNRIMITLSLMATLAIVGCTQQERAKEWGGTANIKLPAGQKLVVATWKESHLWLLTRPIHTNEFVETYTFKESSSWGILQGNVNIMEVK